MLLMGLVFISFSLIDGAIKSVWAVVVLSIILRLLQGIAGCTMQTTCYAVGSWECPEKTTLLIGGLEGVTGLGLIIGPWIGTPLYNSVGFSYCFLISGGLMCVLAIIFACLLP